MRIFKWTGLSHWQTSNAQLIGIRLFSWHPSINKQVYTRAPIFKRVSTWLVCMKWYHVHLINPSREVEFIIKPHNNLAGRKLQDILFLLWKKQESAILSCANSVAWATKKVAQSDWKFETMQCSSVLIHDPKDFISHLPANAGSADYLLNDNK